MKNTLLHKTMNLVAALCLLTGIATIGTQAPLYASLTGPGSMSIEWSASPEQPLLRFAPVPPDNAQRVNAYQTADAGIQLVLGILFIVLGFFLHGLSRMRSERPVHITVAPPKPKKPKTWFWVEMRI